MIVVLTHNYPSDDDPVVGLFVRDHVAHLESTRNAPVKVFNYSYGEYPITNSIKNPLKWPKFIRYILSLYRGIKKDIDECVKINDGQPVEIIAHWWIPQGVFAAKYFDNVQVICHGTDLALLKKYPFVARYFANHAKRVKSWRCVSTYLKKTLTDLYPFIDNDRIIVKPMPISSLFVNKKHKREKNLIISVGSLYKKKGFDILIKQVAKIPGMKLDIYGEGPERSPLQKLINDHDASDRINLAGAVSRQELVEIYNKAFLFVLLSKGEGYGLVLKEAQICGCKTMAFAGDGKVDTGLDYELQRDEDVSERIKQAMEELSLNM